MGEAEVAEDIAQHDGAEQACAQGVCVERELVSWWAVCVRVHASLANHWCVGEERELWRLAVWGARVRVHVHTLHVLNCPCERDPKRSPTTPCR